MNTALRQAMRDVITSQVAEKSVQHAARLLAGGSNDTARENMYEAMEALSIATSNAYETLYKVIDPNYLDRLKGREVFTAEFARDVQRASTLIDHATWREMHARYPEAWTEPSEVPHTARH